MKKEKQTKISMFYEKLKEYIHENGSTRTREVYDLFDTMNKNTVSWTLYKLVQMGLIYRKE